MTTLANAYGIGTGDTVSWKLAGSTRTGVVERVCDEPGEVPVEGTDHVLHVEQDALALIALHERGRPTGKTLACFCSQLTRGEVKCDAMDVLEKRVAAHADEIDAQERAVPFLASDASVDRYGDMIDPQGWDLRAFKRNPVLLWMHNQAAGPIGNIVVGGPKGIRVEDGQRRATAKFAAEGLSEPLERLHLWDQVKAGLLRAFSIAGRPLVRPEPILDAKGVHTGGLRYPKVELLEISLVTVPGNANALAVARSFGVAESDLSQVYEGGRVGPEPHYYDTLRAHIPGGFKPRQA